MSSKPQLGPHKGRSLCTCCQRFKKYWNKQKYDSETSKRVSTIKNRGTHLAECPIHLSTALLLLRHVSSISVLKRISSHIELVRSVVMEMAAQDRIDDYIIMNGGYAVKRKYCNV